MKPAIHAAALLVVGFLAGCAHHGHRSPELSQRPFTPQEADWAAAQHTWLPQWQHPQRAPVARPMPGTPQATHAPARVAGHWTPKAQPARPPQPVATAASTQPRIPVAAQKTEVLGQHRAAQRPAMPLAVQPVTTKQPTKLVRSQSLPAAVIDDHRRIRPDSPPAFSTPYTLIPDDGARRAPKPHTHIVESGQSLAEIAAKYYGDSKQWPRIQQANGLRNPNQIAVGAKLLIP